MIRYDGRCIISSYIIISPLFTSTKLLYAHDATNSEEGGVSMEGFIFTRRVGKYTKRHYHEFF